MELLIHVPEERPYVKNIKLLVDVYVRSRVRVCVCACVGMFVSTEHSSTRRVYTSLWGWHRKGGEGVRGKNTPGDRTEKEKVKGQ